MKTLLALLIALPVPALAQVYAHHFQEVVDPVSDSAMRDIEQTPDAGYAYTGTFNTTVLASGVLRPLLTKLDANFQVQWDRTYITAPEFFDPSVFGPEMRTHDLYQMGDDGYILAGRYLEEGGVQGAFLLRLSPMGEVWWFQVYPGITELTSVVQSNQGFIAIGRNAIPGQPQDAVMLSTDAGGSPVCSTHVWGEKDRDRGSAAYNQVIRYGDELFAAVGTANITLFDQDVLVSTFDENCRFASNRIYGDGLQPIPGTPAGTVWGMAESGASIAKDGTTDRLVVTGTHSARCVGVCVPYAWDDILVFSLSKRGAVRWAKRYDVQEAPDAGTHLTVARGRGPARRTQDVWVTGHAHSDLLTPGIRNDDAFLLQLRRRDGLFRGMELFGDTETDRAYSVIGNRDANIVMLGDTESFGAAQPATHIIERYNSTTGECRDTDIEPIIVDVELPLLDPVAKQFPKKALGIELVDVDPEQLEQVICEKRRVR